MKLKVPYFAQEQSKTCGIAALRMVLDYHSDPSSEKELLQDIKLHSFGTFSTDLGSIALKRAHKVKSYTMHLSLLGPLNLSLGQKVTQQTLKKVKVLPKDQMTFQSWESYLKSGGELVYDFPKIEQLIENLEQSVPCIISVNTTILGDFHQRSDNAHQLVVIGHEDNNIIVLDPEARERLIDRDQLLAAWIVNAIRSSAYLLTMQR